MKPALMAVPLIVIVAAAAQEFPAPRQPKVTFSPPELTSVDRGHQADVRLQFRIPSGYHINSNQPKQEYLKKTELKMDPPTDIAIEGVNYPAGEDRSFPFAPDEKLSVYTGDFAVKVVVRPLKSVLPARYAIHGVLKYQACDNAACYPPKQLPVSFEVKVINAASGTRHGNPPQSPHVHK
jgi:hypothetical protein